MKMAEIKTIYKGESVTLLFTFPAAYDMARLASHKIFVGETEFTGVIEGQTIRMQLKSSDTDRMIGTNKVVLWIDDAVLGLRKPYCGELVIAKTHASGSTASVSNISDIIIPIVISETAVTVGDVLYNYVKGDKGDPFTYSDFTPEQIAELQQPATEAISSIEAIELAVEQAEALRVTAEQARQTNTATAIFNAEQATDDANDAAILANEKAGLANNAALLAIEKAGLADTAATNANTKAGLADAAATNANNVANTYAAELALKELKANKQNSLAPDGTGTKFPTVDAVNAGLNLKQDKNFIGEYIHSGNKEVIISDYNATTGVFTSVAHGIANGTALYFVARKTITYPLSVVPDSSNLSSAYYVIESTNDTFKLAATAGGAVIIFGNTTISLADFFLEVRPYNVTINLGAFYNNLVQIAISNNAGSLIGINLQIGNTGWRSGNSQDYQNPSGDANRPTITGYIVSEYRFINGICFIRQNGQIVYASSKTSNGVTTHNNRIVTKVTAETGINNVILYSPSNGQKLLFYKI